MARFTAVTGGMVVLLAAAMLVGGLWAWLAVIYISVFTYAMDRITAIAAPDHPGQEFPVGTTLSVALALVQVPLLYGGIAALAGSGTTVDKALIFIALSLFLGQVGNANAHELIHRQNRWQRRLGIALYASLLFGHHASAHVRVHHVHAATARDPNSARMGEGFWRFLGRAWRGELVEGFRAEARLRNGRGRHPYVGYALGAAISLTLAGLVAGWSGPVWLVALAAYAQLQLYLSDYVQHYGLRRRETSRGPEPVGPQHSWNAPHGFSSALMVNAPRHSDHHIRPTRAFPGLELDRETMPMLPHPLPLMAVIALVPPLWRRVMDPHARRWAENGTD